MHTSPGTESFGGKNPLILAYFQPLPGQWYLHRLSTCFDSHSRRCVHTLAASGRGSTTAAAPVTSSALLQRVLLNGLHTADVVAGPRIGASSLGKGTLFHAPAMQ